MFKVNEYKVVFKRVWHQPERHVATCRKRYAPSKQPCGCNRKFKINGRYDTKCEIYVQNKLMSTHKLGQVVYSKEPRFTGIAKLHPNDKPDKVDGKKFALRNAIGLLKVKGQNFCRFETVNQQASFIQKDVRTAIWKAFWVWVTSWK